MSEGCEFKTTVRDDGDSKHVVKYSENLNIRISADVQSDGTRKNVHITDQDRGKKDPLRHPDPDKNDCDSFF